MRALLSRLGAWATRALPAAKPAPVPLTLPETVATALDAASIVLRHGGGENGDETRAVVQLAGLNGIYYTEESANQLIRTLWPDLPDALVVQAVRRLGMVVVGRLRTAATNIEPERKSWMNRY